MWVVALAALGLSVYNLVEEGRPADVRLVLATQVRLTVGPDAQVYLQPVFVSTAANDRAEVVDAVRATMTRAGTSEVTELVWHQTGTFDVGPNPGYVVSWRITDLRPEPILVTPADPGTQILRFHTASPFTWVPGTYRIDVEADRLVADEPLVGSLSFELTEADVAEITTEGATRFVTFDARPDGG